jgi:hypothetical protein
MSLQTNIAEYCNHFDINLDSKNNVEDWLKSQALYETKHNDEFTELINDTKYNNINYCSLNTSLLPDVFTNRALNGGNFFPEVGLMFVKTYMAQLLSKQPWLSPEKLYKVFNKNQELVEIPYPIALYLGGLYYFTLGESGSNIILPQDNEYLFTRINGVPLKNIQDKVKYDKLQVGNDVYNHIDLYRRPTMYGYTSNALNEILYYPSVRILNRSIYGDFVQSSRLDNETEFNIKTGYDITGGGKVDIVEAVSIPHKSAMPPVGFGIQNKFLNHYNKVMFGDYLSGTTELKNDGKPHVISGGHSGIIKPIKTYNSNDIEFTAFYRNGFIGSFNYNIDDIKTELSNATNGLKKNDNKKDPNFYPNTQKAIIKSFIAFSKLKANFLSGSIPNKEALKNAIVTLCSVRNIDSQFRYDLLSSSTVPIVASGVADLYFLVSQVFFTSFKNENPEAGLTKEGTFNSRLDIDNIFGIDCRLSYGYNPNTNNLNKPSYKLYQTVLPETLDNTLNSSFRTISEQIDSLTEFLSYIWTLEKINFRDKFNKVDSKASYTLYPSCGGMISPNSLIHNPNTFGKSGAELKLGNVNYITNNISNNNGDRLSSLLYRDNDKVTYDPEIGSRGQALAGKFKSSSYSNLRVCDPKGSSGFLSALSTAIDFIHPNVYGVSSNIITNLYFDVDKTIVLNQKYSAQNKSLNLNNPNKALYLMNKEFNKEVFLDEHNFNNHTILRNTTRFLWFDTTKYGDDLLMERTVNGSNYENLEGTVDMVTNTYGWNYFDTNYLHISTTVDNFEFNKSDYFEQFKLGNLLDSVNFTQLAHFKNLFVDFCKFGSESYIKKGFNLKSLMLASSVVTYDDIKEFTDPKTNIKLSGEEINLTLIGNSMYNYEFMAEIGLSKFLNVALTSAQKDKTYSVIDEFCADTIVHANYSPSNSLYYNDSTPKLSLHNLIAQPEILFSNKMTYSEIVTDLGKTVDDTDTVRYFSRKALFGDTYIAPYTPITKNEKGGIIYLNSLYMTNKLFTKGKITDVDLTDLYATIVIKFFEFLNIKYTPTMYYFLSKFIRTYVYRVLSDLQVLNNEYLPGNALVEHKTLYDKYIKPVEDAKQKAKEILEAKKTETESLRSHGLYRDSNGDLRPNNLGPKY